MVVLSLPGRTFRLRSCLPHRRMFSPLVVPAMVVPAVVVPTVLGRSCGAWSCLPSWVALVPRPRLVVPALLGRAFSTRLHRRR